MHPYEKVHKTFQPGKKKNRIEKKLTLYSLYKKYLDFSCIINVMAAVSDRVNGWLSGINHYLQLNFSLSVTCCQPQK